MGSYVIVFIISAFLCSCGQQNGALTSIGSGAAMSDGEAVLFGGNECRVDADCKSEVCAGSVCVGFLTVPADAARELIGKKFQASSAGKKPADPGPSAELAQAVARIVGDMELDPFMRSRAADFMRFMPCADAGRVLPPYINDREETVRFYVARTLAACGDEKAAAVLRTFLEHDSEAVRIMAATALKRP